MNVYEQIKIRTNDVLRMDKVRKDVVASEQIKRDIEMVLASYAELLERPHVFIEVDSQNRYKISIEVNASQIKSI